MKWVYKFIFFILRGISILPLKILYIMSDIFFVFLYHVFKYRRMVVRENLINSFPQMSENEIINIEKKFYLFFCDWFMEQIKFITISQHEIQARFRFADTAYLDKYYTNKKSFICVLGHFGNWEWAAPAFDLLQLHQLYIIYKPLSNKYFDSFMQQVRTRFHARLIPMAQTYKYMKQHESGVNATVFVGDQTPAPENATWVNFLNQDTAVYKGTEAIAKKLNIPVLYLSIYRPQRGYYLAHLQLICEVPQDTEDGYITQTHTQMLEKDIFTQPEIWLWSHKRWKHKRNNQ
ncbi:MAG: lipid A biosynthesis acyltransferase [Cytophagales bacterium]|nr:lipid A biosynthesis acyltransferase [Cytophagales bacterium]